MIFAARLYKQSTIALASLGAMAALSCASKNDRDEKTTPPTSETTKVEPTHADPNLAKRSDRSPIPTQSKQLVVTLTDDWQGTNASLHRFEREAGGDWREVGVPFVSAVGHTGLAWGRGLHSGARAESEPRKVEGDGKSPAGVFAIGALYGYDEKFSGQTDLPYQQVDASWRCVNDSKSKHYNRVLNTKGIAQDWQDAEEMRRSDERYRLVIGIDHNAMLAGTPAAEGGSCIFFHVWQTPKSPTIGCTSMSLAQMTMLASWLAPAQQPILVALPQERYQALAAPWGLPKLSVVAPDL